MNNQNEFNQADATITVGCFVALLFFVIWVCALFSDGGGGSSTTGAGSLSKYESEVDKIIKAKSVVRSMVNYPDTLDFWDLSTEVDYNTVTLKFTCENAFGVPETHTMDIEVK